MKFIYNGNSNKSGVYRIVNTQNGRIYIGSAKTFKTRWKDHYWSLKNNKHHNKFLQNDFNKCGEDAFEFQVLEVAEGEQENRLLKEEKYIQQYYDDQQQCYNFKKRVVDGQSSWSHNPEETKKKKSKVSKKMWKDPEFRKNMSEKMKLVWQDPKYKENISQKNSISVKKLWQDLEYRETLVKKAKERFVKKENHPMFGKRHSEESKKKMSEALTGRKLSENHKQKLSELFKGRKISEEHKQRISQLNSKFYDVRLLSPDRKVFGPIQNLTKFCRIHNLNRRHLTSVINKKRKSHKGWELLK